MPIVLVSVQTLNVWQEIYMLVPGLVSVQQMDRSQWLTEQVIILGPTVLQWGRVFVLSAQVLVMLVAVGPVVQLEWASTLL